MEPLSPPPQPDNKLKLIFNRVVGFGRKLGRGSVDGQAAESRVVKVDAESVINHIYDVINQPREGNEKLGVENVPDYKTLDGITIESLQSLSEEAKGKLEVVGKYLYNSSFKIEEQATQRLLDVTGVSHTFQIKPEDREKISKQDAIQLMTEMYRVEAARSTGTLMMIYPEEEKGDKNIFQISQTLGYNAVTASQRLWTYGYNRLSQIYHTDINGEYTAKPIEPEYYPKRYLHGKEASYDYSQEKIAYITRPMIRWADKELSRKDGLNNHDMIGVIDRLFNCHIFSASDLRRFPPEYIPKLKRIEAVMYDPAQKFVDMGSKFHEMDISNLQPRMVNFRENIRDGLKQFDARD